MGVGSPGSGPVVERGYSPSVLLSYFDRFLGNGLPSESNLETVLMTTMSY